MKEVKRGEIYYANLCPVIGSEQGGIRPVIILQNDTGNRFSPTTIVAAITSRLEKTELPTHVRLTKGKPHTEGEVCPLGDSRFFGFPLSTPLPIDTASNYPRKEI